ncbi:MAG: response regulator transcription factor [Proteobacteria bacterium]|nr:response regulator transcription factor [Pseudomonadota bacterium]
MAKILFVEDDLDLQQSLKQYLEKEKYSLYVCSSVKEAEAKLSLDWDLLLVDWNLPDGEGIDLIRRVRLLNDARPVVLLTARTELVDKVLGLELGASDYICKPFEPRELLALLRARLRDARSDAKQGLTIPLDSVIQLKTSQGVIQLNKIERSATFKADQVELTKLEFDLLFLLASETNRVFLRDELLNQVWGFDNYPTTRTVDTHVLQLRNKFYPELIETVRGVGYKLICSALMPK